MQDLHTIIIAGKAGEGVKKAAQVIARALLQEGRYAFQNDDYQSLIKGGHNFSTITSSSQPVFCTYKKADLIICLDKRSVQERKDDLKPNAVYVYNSDEIVLDFGIGIPMTSIMKRHYQQDANLCVAPIAIFYALYGYSRQELAKTIGKAFKKGLEENTSFAGVIYESVAQQLPRPQAGKPGTSHKLFSGNQLIGLGAWTSGLDFYYGYPMTPASSLLHFLASQKEKLGVYAVHAESELAAINMAIGSAFTGCRAAVGSSGGGFALMQEAFSMAGMVEAPLFCVLSSRPGPATGVSTYTAQEDLFFALHQGHGEFARIVASPDCHERAYSLASELLSLAWELQIPTILLTEKHLSESSMNLELKPEALPAAEPVIGLENDDYDRYEITRDGISPLLFPPSDSVIKWNSHEHLPSGLRTDKAAGMIAMKDKRAGKKASVSSATRKYQRIAIYGDAERTVFAYGSTVLELREAAKHLPYPICIVALIYLEPFPVEELSMYNGKEIVVVDHSQSGMFCQLLQDKLEVQIKKAIQKYDGRPFDPLELATELKETFDA